MLKTITRTLDVGKWRVGIDGGYDVDAVKLRGMRNRDFPLLRVEKDEFLSRCQRSPDGTIDNSVVIRGVPVAYMVEAGKVWLWPSPAHQWTIAIDLHKRGAKE